MIGTIELAVASSDAILPFWIDHNHCRDIKEPIDTH